LESSLSSFSTFLPITAQVFRANILKACPY
jgi:hypothetical protein